MFSYEALTYGKAAFPKLFFSRNAGVQILLLSGFSQVS